MFYCPDRVCEHVITEQKPAEFRYPGRGNKLTIMQVIQGNEQLRRTPRKTPGLNQILGNFKTITEALDYAAWGDTGFNFYSPRGALQTVMPYSQLRKKARETGRKLMNTGLERGQRVSVVAETGPEFMIVFFGCQYAGLVPCPLPYSMHIGGREAYVNRVAGMMQAADASAVVTTADIESHIREAAEIAGISNVMTHEELQSVAPDGDLKRFEADEVAYIQYSSGSTSAPKGVLISQKAITSNARAILEHGLEITSEDRAFSWLPLYHDMGLVGFCLAPMMGQTTVDYMATPAFARRPALWLKLMSDNKSTVCFAPSFGFDLASRRINGSAAEIDLSSWRIAGIGGDMVRPDVLEEFTSRLAVAGFDPKAFLPSYGMAETTLAISFARLDSEIKIDVVDKARMKLSQCAVPASDKDITLHPEKVRKFVACGKVLPGHEMIVRNDKGEVLGEREIGKVFIKGPSLMSCYYLNDEATSEVFGADGFMDTGDMGYMLDGQIVLTGRAKDMILHNGRNIWPQDIEWAVEQIEGLRSGDVAAFGVEDENGEEHVTVLVQCRSREPQVLENLRHEVSQVVHRSSGVECDVVLVPTRSLPFTSSGKLSRAGAKSRYLSGEIAEIAVAPAAVEVQVPQMAAVG